MTIFFATMYIFMMTYGIFNFVTFNMTAYVYHIYSSVQFVRRKATSVIIAVDIFMVSIARVVEWLVIGTTNNTFTKPRIELFKFSLCTCKDQIDIPLRQNAKKNKNKKRLHLYDTDHRGLAHVLV